MIARIPGRDGFEDAAAVADGALSAMSLLRQARPRAGEHVLVYGASGSIGVGGVQVAKHLGAQVTAVCNAKNLDWSLARCRRVIDYKQEDFTKDGETYDVVFDAVGKRDVPPSRGSLKPGGRYITTDPGFLWHDAAIALLTKQAKLGIVRTRSRIS